MDIQNECEKLILEGKSHLSMSCVDSVDGFNEQMLKLTVKGDKVLILGDDIKITAFNKSNGNLSAEGKFYQVKYGYKSTSFVKKVFK